MTTLSISRYSKLSFLVSVSLSSLIVDPRVEKNILCFLGNNYKVEIEQSLTRPFDTWGGIISLYFISVEYNERVK